TKAKYDAAAIARARELLAPAAPAGGGGRGGRGGGGGGGRGGRGGGQECHMPLTQWDTFCARPAEGAAGGGGGGGGRGAGGPIGPESDKVRRIFDIIGVHLTGGGRGGRGGFGGFGGGNTFTVGTGDYLVTLVAGGQTQKQTLHVERTSGTGEEGNPFGVGYDEEEHDAPRRSGTPNR
ncbi:MAG TPA: hypothetical protein VG916_06615, partial [Gemmatimonadaceae bacterium]|nr:hypothetical protein [Gemmatimonadaceae bacterium]